jgi:chromosome segregation ATPase
VARVKIIKERKMPNAKKVLARAARRRKRTRDKALRQAGRAAESSMAASVAAQKAASDKVEALLAERDELCLQRDHACAEHNDARRQVEGLLSDKAALGEKMVAALAQAERAVKERDAAVVEARRLREQDVEAKPLRERLHRKTEELKELRAKLGQEVQVLRGDLARVGLRINEREGVLEKAVAARNAAIVALHDALAWCGEQAAFAQDGDLRKEWMQRCQPVLDKVGPAIQRVPAEGAPATAGVPGQDLAP